MSDLTERLRALGDVRTSALYHQRVILNGAADEIERLRAALAEANTRLERYRLANTEENDLNILAHEIDAATRALKEKP